MKSAARLLLLAVVGMAALAALPHASLAQTATGAPATTQIKIFVPFAPDGTLNASLQVRSRDAFPDLHCQAGSISTTRPDAWRCGTDDPCFAPPFADPNASSVTLACSAGPRTGSVQLLTVQGALRTADACKSPPACRQPLDLSLNPWAVELANGIRCALLTGTISSQGGVGMVYGCANQDGTPAGLAGTVKQGLDRSQSLWQVFYQAPGDYVLAQTGVAFAWW
ncbi:MAG TPA: hypothetical protein VK821_10250 [Dehalococcoidia bacterium]|nr:hypothetical protein [Dehalococcoidia bacterium]